MKTCKCGTSIPRSIKIDGIRKTLSNRTQCLVCLPFGQSRYRPKTTEEKRTLYAQKARQWYKRAKERLGKCPIQAMRLARRVKIINLLGGKCQFCGYKTLLTNLAFHHLADKEGKLSSREFQFSLKKLLSELQKCVLCCHNCHGEIHAQLIDPIIVSEIRVRNSKILDTLHNKSWEHIIPALFDKPD